MHLPEKGRTSLLMNPPFFACLTCGWYGNTEGAPKVCPECGSNAVTELDEEELNALLPEEPPPETTT